MTEKRRHISQYERALWKLAEAIKALTLEIGKFNAALVVAVSMRRHQGEQKRHGFSPINFTKENAHD